MWKMTRRVRCLSRHHQWAERFDSGTGESFGKCRDCGAIDYDRYKGPRNVNVPGGVAGGHSVGNFPPGVGNFPPGT